MDLSNVQTPNSILPAGQYMAVITGIETKASKTGGEYVQVEFTTSSQGFEGRKIWDNFNTKNDNAKAVEIGLGKLKQLALAIGFSQESLKNFEVTQLANKEVAFKSKIKNDPNYGEKAEIASYMEIKKLPAHSATKTTDIPF